MSGSRTGSITQWNDAIGDGLITEDGDGVHVVSASDCSSPLANALRGRAIPPAESVAVTFDLDLTNNAINVDLTQAVSIAASAAPMAVRSLAAQKAPEKAAKKQAPKKKAAKAPPKRAKKKSAGKKVAAKKVAAKRSRKQVRKLGAKKKRR
jgi:hypothetical protein